MEHVWKEKRNEIVKNLFKPLTWDGDGITSGIFAQRLLNLHVQCKI